MEPVLYRVHGDHDGDPPGFRAAGRNRFDAPQGEFRTTYAAETARLALLESVFHGTGCREVAESFLRSRKVSVLSTATGEALRVVDLTGDGLARIGADARLCCSDHRVAQRWALALWSHPDEPDGLLYRSRRNPEGLCAVFFERAADRLLVRSTSPIFPDYQELVHQLLQELQVALL